MDPGAPTTAADVLNTYSHSQLTQDPAGVRRGAVRPPHRLGVVREREPEPFTSSARLVDLVRANVPAATRRTGGNPAKRTFQALRIEVNDELGVVERSVPMAFERLAAGGRLAVLTFHSLEDRIVKNVLRELSTQFRPARPAFRTSGFRAARRTPDPGRGDRRRDGTHRESPGRVGAPARRASPARRGSGEFPRTVPASRRRNRTGTGTPGNPTRSSTQQFETRNHLEPAEPGATDERTP